MGLISIIIPFYNAQKYLERCISSVLAQTDPDFELILVNDCSTDQGLSLCEKYAGQDKRIRILQTEQNLGVSSARNVGIEHSGGAYIAFVDSDDWIDPQYIAKLRSNSLQTRSDLICCSHTNQAKDIGTVFYTCDKDVVIPCRTAIIGLFQNRFVQPTVWGKLFKKEIIRANSLRFDADISMSEDIKFVYEYLSSCRTCSLIREPLYWYAVDNPGSAMNSDRVNLSFQEKWLSAWTAYVRMREHTRRYFRDDPEVERVFLCSQTNSARMKLHLILEFCYSNKRIYRELTDFLRKHMIMFIRYDYSNLSRKLMIGLCALSPKLEFQLWKRIRS